MHALPPWPQWDSEQDMNRRIQKALDGELPVAQLTAVEREELAACEHAIELAVNQMPDPGPVPDMAGAVLWRIAHAPAPPQPRGVLGRLAAVLQPLGWLWRPRLVTLRPVSVLAVLALLAVSGLALFRYPVRPAATALQDQAANQLVQFRLGAAGVREVALVGDFGGWKVRYPMAQVAPGVWSTAVPLEPGVYDYAFVVDGSTWVLDPLAPAVSDGFGGANSRLSVLAPERRART